MKMDYICRRCGRLNPDCGGKVDSRGLFFCKDCDDKYSEEIKNRKLKVEG